MNTKTLTLSSIFCLCLWWGFFSLLSFSFAQEDFTDSGVGCIDDCLEPQEEN